ncbi:hypothetical protein TYRP_006081 [Tyrophagus putrescentiae]|nr:hypothetical protein TYRP_006081 [Tyrophagus putrescentiae]
MGVVKRIFGALNGYSSGTSMASEKRPSTSFCFFFSSSSLSTGIEQSATSPKPLSVQPSFARLQLLTGGHGYLHGSGGGGGQQARGVVLADDQVDDLVAITTATTATTATSVRQLDVVAGQQLMSNQRRHWGAGLHRVEHRQRQLNWLLLFALFLIFLIILILIITAASFSLNSNRKVIVELSEMEVALLVLQQPLKCLQRQLGTTSKSASSSNSSSGRRPKKVGTFKSTSANVTRDFFSAGLFQSSSQAPGEPVVAPVLRSS